MKSYFEVIFFKHSNYEVFGKRAMGNINKPLGPPLTCLTIFRLNLLLQTFFFAS